MDDYDPDDHDDPDDDPDDHHDDDDDDSDDESINLGNLFHFHLIYLVAYVLPSLYTTPQFNLFLKLSASSSMFLLHYRWEAYLVPFPT